MADYITPLWIKRIKINEKKLKKLLLSGFLVYSYTYAVNFLISDEGKENANY
jgi:hypothetical protein